MASIFRRTRSYPIPDGAEIVTDRKGQRFAKWTDRKTKRTRKEPLNADGDKVMVESGNYLIAYFDADGKRRTGQQRDARPGDGRTNRGAVGERERCPAEDAASSNAEQEQLADAGQRTLAQHLADFEAGMVAAGRTSDHVTRTVGFIREIVDAAGYVNLADIKADGVNRYASDLTTKGKAARTVQARLTAIKSFTRWLATHGKLARRPPGIGQETEPGSRPAARTPDAAARRVGLAAADDGTRPRAVRNDRTRTDATLRGGHSNRLAVR